MNFVPPPNKQVYYNQVWAFVRQIPSGKVATYGQVMKALPRPKEVEIDDYKISASRWVGSAMAACPNDVPWHRVINSQGKISHQTGVEDQKALLILEGVLFLKDRVDLKVYQWQESSDTDE